MRRPNGYGTIVKLSGARRKPWAVRVAFRDEKNRVQQKYLSYHATSQEALDAIDEYNRLLAEGKAPEADKLSMTWQQVYDAWSARAYTRLNAASVVSSKAAWKRVSVLAALKMRTISTDQMQAIIDADESNGLSKSSIYNDILLFKNLFSYAMERDIVGKDYSAYLEMPKVAPKQERRPFSAEEFQKIEALAASGVPWADTILFLCYTGWRISEFLALKPEDYHGDGNYLEGGTKTAAGKGRMIPVHPKIKQTLNTWLAKGGTAIICGGNGKQMSVSHYRSKYFDPLVTQIGVSSATPHWCRYTFAGKLKKGGADELVRKRLLGHSDKDVTEHYTKTDLQQLTDGINLME